MNTFATDMLKISTISALEGSLVLVYASMMSNKIRQLSFQFYLVTNISLIEVRRLGAVIKVVGKTEKRLRLCHYIASFAICQAKILPVANNRSGDRGFC